MPLYYLKRLVKGFVVPIRKSLGNPEVSMNVLRSLILSLKRYLVTHCNTEVSMNVLCSLMLSVKRHLVTHFAFINAFIEKTFGDTLQWKLNEFILKAAVLI